MQSCLSGSRKPLYLVATAAIASLALLAPSAVQAQTLTDPPVKLALDPAYFEDTKGFVVANSPRGVSGVTPSAAAEAAYAAQFETSPSFSDEVITQLRREMPELLNKTKLFRWSVVGTVFGGFGAGYAIGTGIWMVFGEDYDPPAGTYEVDMETPVAPGDIVFSDGSGETYAPDWGLVGGSTQAPVGRITDTGACEIGLSGPGTRLYAPGNIATAFCGTAWKRQYVLFRDFSVVRCGTVDPCDGINPTAYNGAGQPTLPSEAELEELVDDELGSGGYSATNRMLNHLYEPENWPDPRVTQDENNHACDRSPGATYRNPGGNSSPSEFTKYYSGPFYINQRPSGYPSTDIYLHYGSTFWNPGRHPNQTPWYRDDWRGFGFRHIEAKHGWSGLDKTETEAALAAAFPIATGDPEQDKYLYLLPVADGAGGVGCIRNVVVRYDTESGDPRPAGIITSYNAVVD